MLARRLLRSFLSSGTDFEKKIYNANIIHYEGKELIESCQIGASSMSIALKTFVKYCRNLEPLAAVRETV